MGGIKNARRNITIADAVTTVRQLTQEEKIRQQCEAREDYYRRTAGREKLLQKTTSERDQAIAERNRVVIERDQAVTERNQAVAERDQAIAEKERLLQILNKQGINITENDV